jgi:hypothetical protein
MVVSGVPGTTRLPSGENTTEMAPLLWLLRGPTAGSLVVASHTRIVWSPEPEATLLPSGENATDVTNLLWPSRGPTTV